MLWIKRHDGGPALFRQTRVGREGAEFTCLKLRSMSVDAEARLAEIEARDHVLFKSTDDPRVTRPGRFIRRFSLDELPQLVERPPRRDEPGRARGRRCPSEVEQYEDDMLRRLNVLPGMTGLWQVSGRSDLSWEDTVRLDLYYVDNWSMVQDLLILARTVTAVRRAAAGRTDAAPGGSVRPSGSGGLPASAPSRPCRACRSALPVLMGLRRRPLPAVVYGLARRVLGRVAAVAAVAAVATAVGDGRGALDRRLVEHDAEEPAAHLVEDPAALLALLDLRLAGRLHEQRAVAERREQSGVRHRQQRRCVEDDEVVHARARR